jgi:septum site-determining protein MinC
VHLSAAEKASQVSAGLPFQIRGSLQTVLSLKILRPEDPSFFSSLLEKVAHAPDFFRNAPIVLDGGAVKEKAPDLLREIVERLKEHRVVPVGLQNGAPEWNDAAVALGLAIFGAGGSASTSTSEESRPVERGVGKPAAKLVAMPGKVVREPVRGGQQLVAPDGDLIVMAPVSAGAEVAAAGHIHIYAPLRGRAFAGMNGDTQAMIFCEQLHAELLSIAGIHLVNEELDARLIGKRVRASLADERLKVEPLP